MKLLTLKFLILLVVLFIPNTVNSKELNGLKNLVIYEDQKKISEISFKNEKDKNVSLSEYENKLVFLMSVEKARFRNPVIPDCKLELNIEALRSHGKVWKYKGEAFVNGKKMADAIWSASIVDRK